MRTTIGLMFIFGTLVLSVPKGRAQWQEAQVPPAGASSLAVQGKTLFSAYFGLNRGNIYRSEDTGRTWHESDTGLDGATVISLYADDSILLAGTYNFGIFRSSDKGRSWHQTDSTWKFTAIHALCSAYGYYFAAAEEYPSYMNALRSTDGGLHWSHFRLAELSATQGSLAVLDTTIFIGGITGDMWSSSDSGTHWNSLSNGQLNAYAMCTEDSFLFVATTDGNFPLVKSTDYGLSWMNASAGIPQATIPFGVNAMISDGENVFIATARGSNHGDHSFVFRSSNNGDSWDSLNGGEFNYEDLNALLVFGGYLFAGGPSLWRRPLSDFNAVRISTDIPSAMVVHPPYPNPFSTRTTLSFSTSHRSSVALVILDVLGRECANIFTGNVNAGDHVFKWDDSQVPDGVYFFAVQSEAGVVEIPMVVRH